MASAPDRNDLVIVKKFAASQSTTIDDHVILCKVSQAGDFFMLELAASLHNIAVAAGIL